MLSSFFFGKDDFTPAVPLPDYIFLEKNSNFTKRELKSLFNRFNSICHPETRLLERRAFLQQPEVAFSPLIPLAYDMELKEFVSEIASESTPNGLTFDRYVKILSVFSQKASINAKLSYYFDIIDQDKNHQINKDDYLRFLTSLTAGLVPGGHFEEKVMDELWENLCKHSGSSVITRENFGHLLCQADLHIYMTISF